jgi:hypothetical protein
LDASKISSGHDGGWLVVDAALEPSWTPVLCGTRRKEEMNIFEFALLLNSLGIDASIESKLTTNCIVLLVLMVATAALTSLGTTSPRYMRQQAMYFP